MGAFFDQHRHRFGFLRLGDVPFDEVIENAESPAIADIADDDFVRHP
jgi:hypothetical protein